MLSSSAAWPSANCPVATSALARASRSSTRASAGASSGSSRSARAEPAPRRSRARAARPPPRPHAGSRRRRRRPVARSARRGARAPPADAPRAAERVGAALVRAEAPAGRRRLVDRPPNERMPEAKAAWHLGLANEVEPQQLVEGLERRRLGTAAAAAASSGSNGSPATAAPSSTRRAPSESRANSSASAAPTAGGTSRSVGEGSGGACRALASQRSGELLEIERVAAALLVESGRGGLVDCFAEELASLVPRQSADLDADAACLRGAPRSSAAASALRQLDAGGRPARGARRASGGRRNSAPSSSTDAGSAQWRSSSTSTSGLRRREPLEQLAYGAVAAVALVLKRGCRAVANRESEGKTARARCERPRRGLEAMRPRPWTYSSSASTNTQKGRSRSSSDADP